jgi:hypothetical protein
MLCYEHRKEPGWNKRKAWAIRYTIRDAEKKYANLTPKQKQAAKEWEIECEFIRAKIADEIKNAKPLDKSYWANTFDPSSGERPKYKVKK